MAISSGSYHFSVNRQGSPFHWVFLVMVMLIIRGLAIAQPDKKESPDLSSPYRTLSNVLLNLRSDNYHPDLAASAFEQKDITRNQALDAAKKLNQVLTGSGITLNMEEVPRENDYQDSLTSRHRYVLMSKYPDIYIEKTGNTWKFSKISVAMISEVHREIYPLGVTWIENLLPDFGGFTVMGLYTWQLEAMVIILLLSFFIYHLLSYVFEKLISGILNRLGQKGLAIGLLKRIARPTSYLVINTLIIILVPSLQLQVILTKYILLALKAIWPLFLTIIFYRFADVLSAYMAKTSAKTPSSLNDQLVPLVRKMLKVFVILSGVLIVLLNLNISILPFITGLSIGGLAFALAAQDTIKNFFGSLMIFIDKPFQVGHWITSGDIDGEVEEVGFRSTRIRTFSNSLISVPNGKLADSTIDNFGLRAWRRYNTVIAITYDTPADLIRAFLEGLNRIVKEHPYTRKDNYNIYLNDLGPHSLNILFYIFFRTADWANELKSRQEILFSILELAEKLKIRFAFPTQTLHVETFPDKTSLTPEYQFTPEELQKKLDEFFVRNYR